MESDMELRCECGNDTYSIKAIFPPEEFSEVWAECTECGRPTRAIEDGIKKRAEYRLEHE